MNATRISILGALGMLLATAACDDKKADPKADAKADAKEGSKADADKPDAKAEAKPAEKPGTNAEPDAAEKKADEPVAGAEAAAVGVAVCDEYIAKYGKCIDEHGPETSRKQLKELLGKSAERFKTLAAGPEKDSLEQACTAAFDAVKKTSKNWGCTYE
jgi:hypothetical protein